MAYIAPIDQPLSETQAKLIAQVGSMKNLADFPFLNKFKLKKEDNVSMFDYLLKVLRAMGIDPQILLTSFLNDFFTTQKLVDFILTGTARLATSTNSALDPQAQLSFAPSSSYKMSPKEIVELTNSNYNWLNSTTNPIDIKNSLTILISELRIVFIKELMILIFGKPKKISTGQSGMIASDDRLKELIDESMCGGKFIFSPSSPANTNNGDLEYNRLQKMEQIKKGNLSFKITCQGVEIFLPDDPTYLFTSAPPGFQGGVPVTPQEAMANVFNYVQTQTQKGTSGNNSQSNSVTSGKNFTQNFLETLISSITTLISPVFVGFTQGNFPAEIQPLLSNQNSQIYTLLTNGLLEIVFPNSVHTDPATGKREGAFVPATSCMIVSNYKKESLTSEQKKKIALINILCNLLLNMLISFLLNYVLTKVKKMIQKYIAKRAQERAQRKISKMKAKFSSTIGGKIQKKANRAVRQAKLLKTVSGILKYSENGFSIPSI